MIVLLCCFEFYMIVLKAELAARVQRWKDEKREAKKCILVSDFFIFYFISKDLYCSQCHMIVLLCCSDFYMIVLKAEQAARMKRRKDEERCRLVASQIFKVLS
jgi:uncharacterized membrane protein